MIDAVGHHIKVTKVQDTVATKDICTVVLDGEDKTQVGDMDKTEYHGSGKTWTVTIIVIIIIILREINNSPHNNHSQHYSHNQNTGKKGMRSNEIPNHHFDDSVNRRLYKEL